MSDNQPDLRWRLAVEKQAEAQWKTANAITDIANTLKSFLSLATKIARHKWGIDT